MRKLALHWQILIALALAVVLGLALPKDAAVLGVKVQAICGFFGELFLRALKMVVMPLIAASIIMGVASVGGTRGLGRLGAKTAGYYLTTSLVAVLLGVVLVGAIEPGIVDGAPAKERIGLSADTGAVAEKVQGRSGKDVVEVFLRLVPENVLSDAAGNQMLGVIFFCLLFGYFMTRIDERHAKVLGSFFQGLLDVMLEITDWVMRFAPLGVFGLVAKVVLQTGLSAMLPLGVFFGTVLLGLVLHAFVFLPVLLLVAKVSPWKHYRAMTPALLMAFSTASSSATLPLTMECVERDAGVSPRVASFTLPLGATVNMDGTALYECVAALFIAQAYGIHLGFAEQVTVVVIALLTSIGVAGIPAASLVAITLILTTIGLPVEAIGLILAVDRVLDMCRTAVNVLSDSCAAAFIDSTEKRRHGEPRLASASNAPLSAKAADTEASD